MVGTKCENMSDQQVGELIARISFLTGMSGIIPAEIIKALANYIRDSFKMYYANEILLAVTMDISGDFGETRETYNSISPKYLQIIMGRYEERAKQDFWKKWRECNEIEPELPQSEKDKLEKQWEDKRIIACNKVIRGEIAEVDFPILTYDFLEQRGLISLNIEEKKEIYTKAKERLLNEAKKSRTEVNFNQIERANFTKLIDNIIAKKETADDQSKIKSMAKIIAVEQFLFQQETEIK